MLTNGKESGRIFKLRKSGIPQTKALKNFLKKFKKGIDKGKAVWYNRQAVREDEHKGH